MLAENAVIAAGQLERSQLACLDPSVNRFGFDAQFLRRFGGGEDIRFPRHVADGEGALHRWCGGERQFTRHPALPLARLCADYGFKPLRPPTE
jgi:hypothetical protein